MSEIDYEPLYQYEDELVSVRIGKPSIGDGAFLAVDGNVQFGFTNDQYNEILLPLLKAITEEKTDGAFKFYKCQNGDYRLQSYAFMIVIENQTGIAFQQHAAKALSSLST